MDDLFCEKNHSDYALGSCDAAVGFFDNEDGLGSLKWMLGAFRTKQLIRNDDESNDDDVC